MTLQISLAPTDYAHAQWLLAHQVRTWGEQVDEILLTVDFHRSRGRFSARWEEGAKQILPLANSIAGARVITIDYGEESRRRIANEFFGGRRAPEKDFRGGPYYSYFFALAAARNDHVFHVDSDMFFGGGSQTWMSEAVTRMEADSKVLIAAPLSGPPAENGQLRYLRATATGETHAYNFDVMTTRLFLLDRRRFASAIGALSPRPPSAWRNRIVAILEGNPVADLPEHLVTTEMRRRGLRRIEFLGRSPGMWSLHPPYRGADFYAKLPALIESIESGTVPEEQRGDHDINDSMVDWSEGRAALRRNRLWRRMWQRWRR